ncbi:hypothetical protein [Serratia marcescens]|uniref:hypothetical protein n=1 Tax=Serratia marcescens TaxID=615 RepID=UPI000E2CBD2F|nr:hypothetical protein [Serratia marcescens]
MVNLSAEVKMMLRSQRALANHLDNGVSALRREVKSSLYNAYHGVEWLSWYAACFNDDYQDECRVWKADNYRLYLCMKEFMERTDAILDMLVLLVNYILNKYDEEMRHKILDGVMKSVDYCLHDHHYDVWQSLVPDVGLAAIEENNFLSRIIHACNLGVLDLERYSVITATGLSAEYSSTVAITKSMSYSIAKNIANTFSLSSAVRTGINRLSTFSFTFFNFVGFAQQAAMSSRRLEMKNKHYYQILYENKMEMFFFLIEASIPPDFYFPSLWSTSEEGVTRILQELMK